MAAYLRLDALKIPNGEAANWNCETHIDRSPPTLSAPLRHSA
jgi:hypothetical protein